MKNGIKKHIEKFVNEVKETFSIEFNINYGFIAEIDEYYIYHNSKQIDSLEKEDSLDSEKLLNCFFEHFYNNNFYNIHLDYQPKIFFVNRQKDYNIKLKNIYNNIRISNKLKDDKSYNSNSIENKLNICESTESKNRDKVLRNKTIVGKYMGSKKNDSLWDYDENNIVKRAA